MKIKSINADDKMLRWPIIAAADNKLRVYQIPFRAS